MPEFTITITRSAVENVDLRVTAKDKEAAERRIAAALNTTARVGPEELLALKGVKIATADFYGDEESSWEII